MLRLLFLLSKVVIKIGFESLVVAKVGLKTTLVVVESIIFLLLRLTKTSSRVESRIVVVVSCEWIIGKWISKWIHLLL
ncbi:hypothetical protein D3C80_1973710 [compost metagenome]